MSSAFSGFVLGWMWMRPSPHWFGYWQQAITWANVDPGLCCHMASLSHNELKQNISCFVYFYVIKQTSNSLVSKSTMCNSMWSAICLLMAGLVRTDVHLLRIFVYSYSPSDQEKLFDSDHQSWASVNIKTVSIGHRYKYSQNIEMNQMWDYLTLSLGNLILTRHLHVQTTPRLIILKEKMSRICEKKKNMT